MRASSEQLSTVKPKGLGIKDWRIKDRFSIFGWFLVRLGQFKLEIGPIFDPISIQATKIELNFLVGFQFLVSFSSILSHFALSNLI